MSSAITAQKSMWNSIEAQRADLAKVLPRHLTVDRFLYQIRMAIAKNDKIATCSPASVFESVRLAADLGLDPSGALGSAWLVPYGTTCQLIPGYRGLIDLACRSGFVKSANAWAIRERDLFEPPFAGKLPKHRPFFPRPEDEQQDPGRIIGAWARMKLNAVGDSEECKVMTIRQLDAIKARSASVRAVLAGKMSKDKSPWFSDEEPMYAKTALRALLKYAPLSATRHDEAKADYQVRFAKAMAIDDDEPEFIDAADDEAPAQTKTEEMKRRVGIIVDVPSEDEKAEILRREAEQAKAGG